MTIKITKDDIFVAELEMKRLRRKAADARNLFRILETLRALGEIELEKYSKDAQRLVPPHKRRVAAMRRSGELDEAKAKREAILAEKDRHGLVILPVVSRDGGLLDRAKTVRRSK